MKKELDQVAQCVGKLVLGKEHEIRLALACLVARGHLLIEDVPGVGKTLLAHTLAKALGLNFARVQFTSDLLPSDILGANVFDRRDSTFTFRPGPIFAEVVLADEINRATPKTQSALLEAMEERQVTVEGFSRELPRPFFVIATQNPIEQVGTFPLPESQLDRFLMRVTLGYPHPEAERQLWREPDRREMLEDMQPCLPTERVVELTRATAKVHVSEPLLDYVHRLVEHTRHSTLWRMGLSPRGGSALVQASKAWALMEGRDYVAPEDIQAVLPSVVEHRLSPMDERRQEESSAELLRSVPVDPGV
jgi:MoxR-like ATPase